MTVNSIWSCVTFWMHMPISFEASYYQKWIIQKGGVKIKFNCKGYHFRILGSCWNFNPPNFLRAPHDIESTFYDACTTLKRNLKGSLLLLVSWTLASKKSILSSKYSPLWSPMLQIYFPFISATSSSLILLVPAPYLSICLSFHFFFPAALNRQASGNTEKPSRGWIWPRPSVHVARSPGILRMQIEPNACEHNTHLTSLSPWAW